MLQNLVAPFGWGWRRGLVCRAPRFPIEGVARSATPAPEIPIFRHLLLGLANDFALIRYDARGNGLSDWDVGEISLDAWVSDMESVVDAVGLSRFPLLGFSQGCAVSIAFAVRHPERVSRLILYGGFAEWRNKRPNLSDAGRERFAAIKTLTKLGWGADDPT